LRFVVAAALVDLCVLVLAVVAGLRRGGRL